MAAPDSDPSATLQAIKDRAGVVAKLGPPRPGGDLINAAHRSAADVPRLLAAVEAVLKLADALAAPAVAADCLDEELIKVRRECGERVREAVTRALNGTPAPAIPATCPESKMDDGAHSGELDGGCAWCGASAAELEGRDA